MRSALATLNPGFGRPDALRGVVHDLRNLFAVVASAKCLLNRRLDERTKAILVDALYRVAADGKVLTDGLLAGGLEDRGCGVDARDELQNLAPILASLEGSGLKIELSIGEQPSWILMPAPEFRALVLELVTNAARAGAHTIRIGAARRGSRFWLTVADDGSGFAAPGGSPGSSTPAGLHGNGLRRLATAVDSARGSVRIRSKRRNGSVVALILPIVRLLPSVRLTDLSSGSSARAGILEEIHG